MPLERTDVVAHHIPYVHWNWIMLDDVQVHSMSQIALKKDHVFIDTVGEEDEETHAKVHNCSNLS